MLTFPLLVLVLTAAFSARLTRQCVARPRPHLLAWLASMLMGLLAAAFYLLFLASGHNSLNFKLYYLFGGILMAAVLGLGSVYLHLPRRVGDVVAVLLALAGVGAFVCLLSVSTIPSRLDAAAANVGPGTNALAPGAWKAFAAVLNSFGAVAVVAGAGYSAYRAATGRAPSQFLAANLLIASGTIVAALAGVAAAQGAFAGSFWALLAAGFAILFSGFLLASGRGRPQAPPA